MTCIVSSGALNSTHSLTAAEISFNNFLSPLFIFYLLITVNGTLVAYK